MCGNSQIEYLSKSKAPTHFDNIKIVHMSRRFSLQIYARNHLLGVSFFVNEVGPFSNFEWVLEK